MKGCKHKGSGFHPWKPEYYALEDNSDNPQMSEF